MLALALSPTLFLGAIRSRILVSSPWTSSICWGSTFSYWPFFFLGVMINLILSNFAVEHYMKTLEAKRGARTVITKTYFLIGFLICLIIVDFKALSAMPSAFSSILSGITLTNFWFWWLSQIAWEKKNGKILVVAKGKVTIIDAPFYRSKL